MRRAIWVSMVAAGALAADAVVSADLLGVVDAATAAGGAVAVPARSAPRPASAS